MAEIVQQVFESSIQDLSVLEKYKLFSKDQIKQILKNRRDFEYRLRKVKKSKEDFLQYISYEECLLKLIRIRRENSALEIGWNEIEKSVMNHIRNLFEFALNKFRGDIPFWLSYINFFKNQNQLDLVSMIYFRMLQIHNKDWLWLQFAKFEFEEKASSETARKVFLKAISFHSDSKQIWQEYFRFELLYCSKIHKRFKVLTKEIDQNEIDEINEKQTNDAVWNGQLASIVYKHSIEYFSDFNFAIAFIDICNEFHPETVNEVKQSIMDDIRLRFGSTEDYWNLIAIDKINHYNQLVRFDVNSAEEQLKLKCKAINEVINDFETSCQNFNSTKMWSFYFNFRLEDLKNITDSKVLGEKIAEIIFEIDKLWKVEKISCDVFQEWIKLMYSCNKKDSNIMLKLQKLLGEASERWSENVQLHIFIACIKTKLPDNKIDVKKIEKFFQDSLFRKFTKVDQQNVDILIDFWQLYLEWALQNKTSYHNMMKIISELNNVCINAPRKMSEYFKSKVLALFYHMFGIEKARIYYNNNKTISPICKNFGYKMVEIERHFAELKEEVNHNSSDHIATVYEDMIHHFGSNDPDLWLAYIRHMIQVDVAKLGELYQKALKMLGPSQCQRFVQQYTLLTAQNCSALHIL